MGDGARGIPSEEVLAAMRDPQGSGSYLLGTSRKKIRQWEQQWLELPGPQMRASIQVKLFRQDGERYVLAKSSGRGAKERRRKLARLLWRLRAALRRRIARRVISCCCPWAPPTRRRAGRMALGKLGYALDSRTPQI